MRSRRPTAWEVSFPEEAALDRGNQKRPLEVDSVQLDNGVLVGTMIHPSIRKDPMPFL